MRFSLFLKAFREERKKKIESMVGLIKSGRIRSGDKESTDIEKRTSERNCESGGGSIIKEQLSRVKDISRESALVQSFMGKL